uniref:PH_16 domain-containing protein n=1 Tax=Angiostrongylus cantonensis TaxID=6313 RepID=A0A0K0DLE5_ANGCA
MQSPDDVEHPVVFLLALQLKFKVFKNLECRSQMHGSGYVSKTDVVPDLKSPSMDGGVVQTYFERRETETRNAENADRLDRLQRWLDTTPFDKKYCLMHNRLLTYRVNRRKRTELHMVLLENMLVFLTKHSDERTSLYFLSTLDQLKKAKWLPIKPLASSMAKKDATISAQFVSSNSERCSERIYELITATTTDVKRVADLKQRDCKELAMSAVLRGNQLRDGINQNSDHFLLKHEFYWHPYKSLVLSLREESFERE